MFVGVINPPAEDWPVKPFTKIKETPVIREKPYLTLNDKGFEVNIPSIKKNSIGPDWLNNNSNEKTLTEKEFYIAKADIDNSESINSALKKGKNLLFTPGMYTLDKSLKVTRKGTVIMGLGMPSLMPSNGNAVIEISDVDGVSVCGLLIDAGKISSNILFQVGESGSGKSHEKDPVFLYDIFFRVGGPSEGSATSCMVINSKDVCVDHVWLWRADHGNGVGWDKNRCANGLMLLFMAYSTNIFRNIRLFGTGMTEGYIFIRANCLMTLQLLTHGNMTVYTDMLPIKLLIKLRVMKHGQSESIMFSIMLPVLLIMQLKLRLLWKARFITKLFSG